MALFSASAVLGTQPATVSSNALELSTGWFARRADEVLVDGTQLTTESVDTRGWLPAVVPGTVLTTLLENGKYPDPNIGMNNTRIPDIADVGAAFFTYWFYTTFQTPPEPPDGHVWLHFDGINYSAQIFLNGQRINTDTHRSMFLRECYDITGLLREDSVNQLAVLVSPPDPVGVANGGQAGDGTIGKSVTNQYVAGWDWMAPVHDRNTGIWDKVFLTTTGPVQIRDPFVRPEVPGVRKPGQHQAAAYLRTSATVFNADGAPQSGQLTVSVGGESVDIPYELGPEEEKTLRLPRIEIRDPKLWWTNGLGEHPLYDVQFVAMLSNSQRSDEAKVQTGIREITSVMDPELKARTFKVNGQPVFIRGGNWITSDWMLRLSRDRYDAEIRYMAGMHLNMLRVWGGGITERPEFYDACDRAGILVMQDLWITGDADGAWHDPRKKDSRARRRFYPDDHSLFLASVDDQLKLLRNHPSLCFWDGGNEQPPPADILTELRQKIMPAIDPDRLFVSHSTSLELYFHPESVTGDGPYGIQPLETFFAERSFPFNPEVGSVGLPEAETLHRLFQDSTVIPNGRYVPEDWRYHEYLPYVDRSGKDYVRQYGPVDDMDTFARFAQLANYNQYRALFEGWNSHMWTWYTGVLIWKLQNPWTALRGQFYDWYLNPNGAMYGLMKGAEPVHVQYDPVSHSVEIVNNTVYSIQEAQVKATWHTLKGKAVPGGERALTVGPNRVVSVLRVDGRNLEDDTSFLHLTLADGSGNLLSRNLYWLHAPDHDFRALGGLEEAKLGVTASLDFARSRSPVTVTLRNEAPPDEGPVAFWVHLQLRDPDTGERVAPAFYSDNYVSLVPAEGTVISIGLGADYLREHKAPQLEIVGWNVPRRRITLHP